jgi:hypothetical protein
VLAILTAVLAAATILSRVRGQPASTVGWYLMLPPSSGYSAPLSDWNILESFDSALFCQSARDNLIHNMRHEGSGNLSNAVQGQCIASDDQRLKDK